jgi:hypothetical protein
MDVEDAGTRAKFVLHNREASFTATFDAVFQAAGVRVVRSAIQAPRMKRVGDLLVGRQARKQRLRPQKSQLNLRRLPTRTSAARTGRTAP